MATHYKGYSFNTPSDRMVLCLDASNIKSYPGSGTTWYNIAGLTQGSYNATLTNTTFASNTIVFNGSTSYGAVTSPLSGYRYNWTIEIGVKCTNASSGPMILNPGNAGIDQHISFGPTNCSINFTRIADYDGHGLAATITPSNYNVLTFVRTPNEIRIYVNGKLGGLLVDTQINAEFSSTWNIARRGNNTYLTAGNLGSIKVWKRVLDDNEVLLSATGSGRNV